MALSGVYDLFNDKWCNQTIWIFSDPHFGETDIKKAYPNRPSDKELVKNINSKVGRKDTLILLGDIGDIEYAKQLRGYKVLIAGNHDAGMSNYKEIFDEIYTGALIIGEKLILSHEPVNVPWAFNIHGHQHNKNVKNDNQHFNVCADVINWEPINFNQWLKQGYLAHIETIHRATIDKATERKRRRMKKKNSICMDKKR